MIALTLIGLLVGASATSDLQKVVVTEDGTNKQVKPGDLSNKAIRVNCVTGCGAGGSSGTKINDGTAAGEADVIGSAPGGTEQGLVTRNIPSGTQTTADTHTTAGAPLSCRLSDGSSFYNASGGGGGGTSSNFTSAFPSAGTATGFSDGTNMQGGRVFDADTGGGTQYVIGASLRKSASGGSVEAGTSTDPLRVDPTGTTTQPVSGTVGVSGSVAVTGPLTDAELRAVAVPVSGTFWQATQPVSASALPLPTGAATAAKQPALGTAGSASADVITVQGITSMTPLLVNGSGVTQPVSGTVTANVGTTNGLALDATVTARMAPLSAAVDGYVTLTNTTLTSVIAGGGGGTRNYVTAIGGTNTSATGVRVDLLCASTVRHSFYVAASGGGFTHIFPFPWRCGDNEAVQAQLSGSVTDVRVSVTGFRL